MEIPKCLAAAAVPIHGSVHAGLVEGWEFEVSVSCFIGLFAFICMRLVIIHNYTILTIGHINEARSKKPMEWHHFAARLSFDGQNSESFP